MITRHKRLLVLFLLAAFQLGPTARGQGSGVASQLDKAKQRATTQTYTLRHRFSPGQLLQWKVTHLATVETKIRGNTQTTQSRTVSTKVWRVEGVDKEGAATIVHSVADVEMWRQLTDRPEARYNSRTDKNPGPDFEPVAKTIGVPLTTFLISPTGKVLSRKSKIAQVDMGFGAVIIPFPETPVKIGSKWHSPAEMKIRTEGGRIEKIKTRHAYKLEKVSAGLATISVNMEVLTPIDDPKLKVKIMQHLTSGRIKFDITAGRVLSKQLDCDETVIGFSGADSMRQYLTRFTEEWINAPRAASTGKKPTARKKR